MPQNGNCLRTDWLYSEEKRLICGCQVYHHFVSTEQGANKVLRWTRQLVMRKSGFHFSVWFKFFIIKMFEEGKKEIRISDITVFKRNSQLLFSHGEQRVSPPETENYTVNSRLILANQLRHQCCPVSTPPQWRGQTSKATASWAKGPGSPHLQLLWVMLHLPKWHQVWCQQHLSPGPL